MCSPEARVKTEFEVEVWWSDVSDFLTQVWDGRLSLLELSLALIEL